MVGTITTIHKTYFLKKKNLIDLSNYKHINQAGLCGLQYTY